jgi:hypothetical protein
MTEATIAFIDQGRAASGIESIGTQRPIAPSTHTSTTLPSGVVRHATHA